MRPLRAVVRRALRDHRRAPLTWGLPLGALCGLIVLMYPSIEDSLKELVRNYPEGLLEAFSIENLDSVEAYLEAEMFSLIIPLAVAFFAVRSIAREIAGAEELGHLDTTLAAPLSRRSLVGGSFAATAAAVAGVLVAVLVVEMLATVVANAGLSLADATAGVVNVWALAVFFAGLAALVAGFVHHANTVVAIAAGTLVAMYVVDLVGKLAEPAEPLRVVSVFKYYGNALTDGLDPVAFAGLVLGGAVLALVGAVLFERRDVLA